MMEFRVWTESMGEDDAASVDHESAAEEFAEKYHDDGAYEDSIKFYVRAISDGDTSVTTFEVHRDYNPYFTAYPA